MPIPTTRYIIQTEWDNDNSIVAVFIASKSDQEQKVVEQFECYTYINIPLGTMFYIGRGSALGNPFPMHNSSDKERERVCVEYRQWLDKKMAENDYDVINALSEIYTEAKHHNVGLKCFCAPKQCHGDYIKTVVLAAIAQSK